MASLEHGQSVGGPALLVESGGRTAGLVRKKRR